MKSILKKLTGAQVITLGFAVAILIGTLLLLLPFSTAEGKCAGFLNAFFTSTSAMCVTGLVVQDTATYWSVFGQIVILIMIQIGGLGVVSLAALVMMMVRHRIGLLERSTMQEAISAPKLSGIVKLTGFVILFTLIMETIGTLLLLPVFCKDFGAKGIWYSIFHSVSAFCNAGFDIVGKGYTSLTAYADNPLLNITLVILIVVGGIGFTTVYDFVKHGVHLNRFSLQSKVILTTTTFLIVLPAIYFAVFEFKDLPAGQRVAEGFFQSVTARTAGFNTADLTTLSDTGIALLILLMLIGGSPGSTAGGMKTTTFVVLLLTAFSVLRRKDDTNCFRRRIAEKTVKNAVTILVLYLVLFVLGGVIISSIEDLPLITCLFETASAVGTVGLTLGITPTLSVASKLVLIVLMYSGRVGALTLVFATFVSKNKNISRYPEEKLSVG